jgi:adenine-specific DNA-methyltransferase
MIYIDPPYNTGNDFVYDDDFTESLQEYLKRTKQVDEEGKALTTNKRSDGRFHSKWLSMMYPRLRLAKNLMKEDGLIFISIDDNEVDKLIMIMNEIFGEENKEGIISWRRRHNQPNDKTTVIGKVAEYVLVYSKNSQELKLQGTFYGIPLSENRIKDYKNPDNDPNGDWSTNPWKAAQGRGGTKYKIVTPTGKVLDETWYGNENTFEELLKNNRVNWSDKGNGVPRIKIYLKEALKEGQSAINFFTHEKFGSNQEGSAELEELFNGNKVFDNPKPTKLLKTFMNIASNENAIVLDFFAGSGSFGHAFYEFEKDNPSNRKFILVQLPFEITEDTDSGKNAIKLGFKNISQITKERIKRVSNRIIGTHINTGFKSFTLKTSNYKPWKNYQGTNIEQLQIQLEEFNQSPLRNDYTKDSLLTEIILLEGFTLCSTISKLNEINTNSIKKITSEYCEHALLVCLDDKIEKETIANIQLGDADVFICLDSAISSEDKLRLSDKGLIKTI